MGEIESSFQNCRDNSIARGTDQDLTGEDPNYRIYIPSLKTWSFGPSQRKLAVP